MFKLAFRSIRTSCWSFICQTNSFYVAPPISKDEVTSRAIQALKTVAPLQESNITLESSFQKDLGFFRYCIGRRI